MSKAVELHKVNLSIGGRKILEDITVSFQSTAFSVIFGPNGAGKTTLLRLLIGELKPDSGFIRILDCDPLDSLKEIGYVAQRIHQRRNFPLTVTKAVLTGRFGRLGLFRRPSTADYDRVRVALDEVGMGSFGKASLSDLSGGELQRVFIARALVGEPKILILDEATSGVDLGAKESLLELLNRLKKRMTIIFVSHDLSIVSQGVDQIICLNKRLVSHGKPEEALNDEAVRCMYGRDIALLSHCHTPHIHVDGPHE